MWHDLRQKHKNNKFLNILRVVLRGYSQVVFQDSPLTGLLFFLGIAVSSYQANLPQVAIGGLVGTIVATLCGLLTKDKEGLSNGMYGYNGCLVGVALPTFIINCVALWVLVVLASILSVLLTVMLTKVLNKKDIAVLTAPFVFSTWIVLIASHHLGHFHYIHTPLPAEGNGIMYIIKATLHGVSQIFLCDNMIGGLLLLLGIAITSIRTTFIVLLAALTSVSVALLQGDDPQRIAAGLYAFSAILTAVALEGILYPPSWRTTAYTFVGIALTVFLQRFINQLLGTYYLPGLTIPFVLVCWTFLFVRETHHN